MTITAREALSAPEQFHDAVVDLAWGELKHWQQIDDRRPAMTHAQFDAAVTDWLRSLPSAAIVAGDDLDADASHLLIAIGREDAAAQSRRLTMGW